MLAVLGQWRSTTVRWAFWRSRSPEPQRALPDDVGLPTRARPPAAPADRDEHDDRRTPTDPAPRTSGAVPTGSHPASPRPELPLTAPTPDVDRTALAGAGEEVARVVSALLTGRGADRAVTDDRTLAVAATGALAARLPALSGVEDAVAFGEPADELLHAYADLLVTRAGSGRAATAVDREDLLAVAHVAAAAATVDAAGDPALLLLAGVPAEVQLRAAALLLAQTADDGGGAPDALPGEVRHLFAASG